MSATISKILGGNVGNGTNVNCDKDRVSTVMLNGVNVALIDCSERDNNPAKLN